MQVDFADPGGQLYVRGGEQILPLVNAEIDAAVEAGSPVFYTQDWHPASTPHFAKDGGQWPVHCVRETPGAELLAGLRVAGPVVRKGVGGEDGYSGFSVRHPVSGKTTETRLTDAVAATGVTRLVVAGLAGDYCVKETALDGRRLGYQVQVHLSATRFVNQQAGDDALAIGQMEAAGVEVGR